MQNLDTILSRIQQSPAAPFLPDDLAYLISSFLPSEPASHRSKAYLIISAFCQGVRSKSAVKGKQPDPTTEILVQVFEPVIISRLADPDDRCFKQGISFLTALYQIDWESAAPIFEKDGVLDLIVDSVDLRPSSELSILVAHLIGQASGHKSSRALIPTQITEWLELHSRDETEPSLRAAASIALVKLSRGRASDAASGGLPDSRPANQDDELADVMKDLVISGTDQSSVADAVEGLAYLSVDPIVKDALSKDTAFLKRLFSLVPRRKPSTATEPNTTLLFGILLTVSNLCAYRPRLTEEQSQIAKLKRMANSTNKTPEEPDSSSRLDDDENVKARIKRLVAVGMLDVFPGALAGTDSPGIRLAAGKALLSIVEDRENRGKVLQIGGAKLLSAIIKHSMTADVSTKTLDVSQLEPIQALAKLAITSSPLQVFGPNDGAVYDAIRPLSLMLQHQQASLLQRFEALMALTNLSSHSAEASSRIAKADGLLSSVELLLLEDHTLVRRASMELICNLVSGSDDVFERYGGTENSNATRSKLQIVAAMSDVEDLGTRLAASGALATLTDASTVCEGLLDLQRERKRILPILAQLVDPTACPADDEDDERVMETDPGLVHRGIVCTRNIVMSIQNDGRRREIAEQATEAGLVQGLVNVVKSSPAEMVLRPAMETLKCLLDSLKSLRSAISGTTCCLLITMAPSKKAGKKTAATPKKGGQAGKVAKADWKEGFKKKQVGVSDMTLLTTISNESINDNLQKRWTNAEIYTYIGAVLISVNPFRDLGIYTDETLKKYRGKNRLEVPPHVFSIAETAYYNMNAYHENQCVIISGESGAGKTEAAKRIMQYIAAVSGGEDSSIQEIKDMVLATNPLLESFGCAKTLRNNNSSRHGKYLEIMFNSHGEPVGAKITNYLLEKGRVVGQIENERDFHIFYQFTKGASSEQREMFGIQGPEAYVYTSASNCLDVSDIDDVEDYHGTIKAMQVIGLGEHEQSEIFRMLAIVLWLGNVQFTELDDGNSTIGDTGVTDFVAYLMEVDSATVQKVLTSKVMETQHGGRRGSVYDVPLNPAQAGSARDALSKAVYNNLFEWIVSRINVSMKPRSAHAQIVGILDIFGFEIFEDNSFEQLCINYVNEKLQQIFIELTLKTEQEEYVREQIKWTPIKYFNNKVVCDLIEEKRPPGIFAALNDACATAHADPAAADNSFVQRASGLASNAHFESRGAQFLVRHYAGDVMYNIAGMTDKNKDTLNKDLLDLIASSENQFLQTLFPDRPDPNSKKRPPTASDRIKASAGALVDNLMKAQPSYIRTIKPNQNRSSSEYDTKAILHQIKYLGLQENIRVRRAGFAYRNTFEKMVERFYLLSPKTSYAGEYIWHGDPKSGCEQILKDTGIAKDEWQMGVTKAFIKNPETLFALETMRDRYWHNMAGRIQRAFRNYMRYKHECARRIQRFWKNNKESLVYAQVRDYGHQILAGRKERRRFSLLSYRRFMGDYLDVNGKSPLGEELGEVCGIGNEEVTFSGRIQLLVSKLGRSSKPSPRFIVVTKKAVHIVVTLAKDGRAQTMLERKIPLVTIKSIGMSTLRDDWMAGQPFFLSLNGNISEEGDPIFSCYFKTELAANLLTLTGASITMMIAPTVAYNKKKDKKAEIKFIKDETVKKDDLYKSHTVHVPSGEPPDSLSRPPAKRKPGVVRPITQGKLLKAGGPSNKPKPASRPKPTAQPLPGKTTTTAVSVPVIKPTPTPAAVPKPSTSTAAKRTSVAAPPPPPPPPPPARPAAAESATPMYRAKFDFAGEEGEMSLTKDDLVELLEKDDNGWWLVKKGASQGWAPNNYLELAPASAASAPPPPARRAVPAKPAATTTTPTASKLGSVMADANAKPVSVFPGMAPANGSATPWKKTPSASTSDSTPSNSRPGSSLAGKPPPPVATKPKPPVVAPKPGGGPKPPVGGKPPIPTAPRPTASGGASKPVGGVGALGGNSDLAALLAKRAQRIADSE
ncbi:Microfilament motor [Mycena indigotica]|uniref:Microfilament motor n=1 Tax=Mycena indigotica TaxID=2126181 RepID=A0A8H6W6Z9_9AGAR|nr:Microfilament motor [Mycena indigotica]KAF7307172.1 Microfilament motor [Mycena indigotica]